MFLFEFLKNSSDPFFTTEWKMNHERTNNAISRGADGFRHLADLGNTHGDVWPNAQIFLRGI
jgi:hypothetical protein